MDSIDITDATFTLSNVVTGGSSSSHDFTTYIYIGIGLLVLLIIVYYVIKRYQTKPTESQVVSPNEDTCDGGFCTMGDSSGTSIDD